MDEHLEITLHAADAEERMALHEAFVRGTTITFRGRRVTVVRQFLRRLPDLAWQVTYRLRIEADDRPCRPQPDA